MSQHQPEGHLAVPSNGQGQPVLVLHPWWGLNATIRSICDRLSESGFIAFAPDLYRGKVVDTIPEAEAQAQALFQNIDRAIGDINAAVRFLGERSGLTGRAIHVIGFSMGANYALNLAANDPDHIKSVVLFYGTGQADFSHSQAVFLGHFAENDDFEPDSEVDGLEAALKDAGRTVTFFRYPGTGHWFFEPDRSDAYNQEAAALAWERTLEFLKPSYSP